MGATPSAIRSSISLLATVAVLSESMVGLNKVIKTPSISAISSLGMGFRPGRVGRSCSINRVVRFRYSTKDPYPCTPTRCFSSASSAGGTSDETGSRTYTSATDGSGNDSGRGRTKLAPSQMSPLGKLEAAVDVTATAFAEISEETDRFQLQTGLACPPGCGQCCHSPQVEASPSEMLPLAAELYRRGQPEKWIEKLDKADGICAFYDQDPDVPWKGRCSVYQWRPSLCRLFGFSTRKNKKGDAELIPCKHMDAGTTAKAKAAVASGQALPLDISTEAQKVWRVGQEYTSLSHENLMNINKAARVALESYTLTRAYAELDEEQ